MLIVLEHGDKNIKEYDNTKYFEITCECGCKFVCTSYDFNQSDNNFLKKINKKFLYCPDCHKKIYNTGNNIITTFGSFAATEYFFNVTKITTISKKRYEIETGFNDLVNSNFD